MTKKSEPNKRPLKAFGAIGLEATVRPPNAKYDEDGPKIRIDRNFRHKNGAFKMTTYFSPEELAVQMEQAFKAIACVQPELLEPTMKSLTEIAKHQKHSAYA